MGKILKGRVGRGESVYVCGCAGARVRGKCECRVVYSTMHAWTPKSPLKMELLSRCLELTCPLHYYASRAVAARVRNIDTLPHITGITRLTITAPSAVYVLKHKYIIINDTT